MQRTPRYPMGTRIKKRFPGYADPFTGTVDNFVPASGFYHITYDDGDSEEMTEDDVESHFLSTARQPRRKPLNNVSPHEAPPNKNTNQDDSEDDKKEEDQEVSAAVVETVSVYQLVGTKVCKKRMQSDGTSAVVKGSVSTYFPATKMYRVVYFNGTTEDMTYRQVVDSVPLAASGKAATTKLKRNGKAAANLEDTKQATPATKKRKSESNAQSEKKAKEPRTDENSNRGNKDEDDEAMEEEDEESVFDYASVADEDTSAWNKSRAFETVRAVLFVISSTSKVTPDAVKILGHKNLKAKVALAKYVELGGLAVLAERLGEWVQSKNHEAGVLAILKMLTIIPAVTKDSIMESRIGKTLGRIRKKKNIASDLDLLVPDMANYVIEKWTKRFGNTEGKSKQVHQQLDKSDRAASSKSEKAASTSDKPATKSDTKSDAGTKTPSKPSTSKLGSSLTHKRSNSAHHLNALLGARCSGDFLGNALGRRSRPLGADHARRPQRSTVLLDTLAERQTKKSEGQKQGNHHSGSHSNSGSGLVDAWVPERVRFGEIAVLDFLKDLEVTRLLDKPGAGGFRPKNPAAATRVPPRDKQPAKSILKVKMGVEEREAVAAQVAAECIKNTADDDGEKAGTDVVTVEGGEQVDANQSAKAADAMEDGPKPMPKSPMNVFAPPSPPRRRDTSDDEQADEVEVMDELQLPDNIVIDMPSPPPSFDPEDAMETKETERRVDELGFFNSGAASPVVSSDAPSSPESGEALEDDAVIKSGLVPPLVTVEESPPPSSSTSPPSLSDVIATAPSSCDTPAVVEASPEQQESSPPPAAVVDAPPHVSGAS